MTKTVMAKQAEWAFEMMMTWGLDAEHVARAYAEVSRQASHPGSAVHWEQVANIIKAAQGRNGHKAAGTEDCPSHLRTQIRSGPPA